MSSFCGFCGAKALDERAKFCSDCGGKLELSTENPSGKNQKSTLPLPSLDGPQGIILSRSFTNLITQEASIGKEISPLPSVDLSKSLLASISGPTEPSNTLASLPEDPLLSRDTLREVVAMPGGQVPSKEPIVTLPDFLAPNHNLSSLEPMTLPVEVSPALKIPKVITPASLSPSLEPERDTLNDNMAARRVAVAPKSEPQKTPKADEPSVLLSSSMEEIILTEKPKRAPQAETSEAKEPPRVDNSALPLLASVPVMIPKLPFKLEAPPKSILLSEPASIVSDGFSGRLAKAPAWTFFSFAEVGRATRSRLVQAILLLAAGPLLVRLVQEMGGDDLSSLQPLFIGFLLCLLFFRLLAEERQPLWRSCVPLLLSFALGLGSARLFEGSLHHRDLLHVGLFSFLVVLAQSATLCFSWFIAPRLHIFAHPIDGLLLGIFSGIGYAAGVLPATSGEAILAVFFVQALCGGFAGYFWGLAFFKPDEKKQFGVFATLVVFLIHAAFSWLMSLAFRRPGSTAALLLLALTLALGYLVLFGYVIKLKQLERN